MRTLIWRSITHIGSIFLLLFTFPWHFKCRLYPSRSSIRYFWRCWAVPLRHIMFQFGPYILSFTCHPSSSGFSLPPPLSRLSLPFRKTVPSSWPYSQASNVSTRFLWLMLLASSPYLKLYNISLSAHVPLNPWISWENVHLNFSRVPQVPSC